MPVLTRTQVAMRLHTNKETHTQEMNAEVQNESLDQNGIISALAIELPVPVYFIDPPATFRMSPRICRYRSIDSLPLMPAGLATRGNGGRSLSKLLLLIGLRRLSWPLGL